MSSWKSCGVDCGREARYQDLRTAGVCCGRGLGRSSQGENSALFEERRWLEEEQRIG
jgi:hypothetical protein